MHEGDVPRQAGTGSADGYEVGTPADAARRDEEASTPIPPDAGVPDADRWDPDHWDADHWDAAAVHRLRMRLGLTQAEFADRVGTRQQTISEWETGASRPRRMSRRLLRMVAEESGVYRAEPPEPSEPPESPAPPDPEPGDRTATDGSAS